MAEKTLTHLGQSGEARMVDVSQKPATERIALAEHHHFESISDAITSGADIVPRVTNLRVYDPPRTIADTEDGEVLRQDIAALERLVLAYQEGVLLERGNAAR